MAELLADGVVVASSNQAKIGEIRRIVGSALGALVGQNELGIKSPPEPHASFVENALAKARHASASAGRPALADDSGLCVEALAGAPGVRSARFAGESAADSDNNRLLLEMLSGNNDRRAHYYCALVLCTAADDPSPIIAQGRWQGRIAEHPRGDGGFGYDPLFELADGRTAAELAPAEKDDISHRGSALRALADQLAQLQ
ncbi:MAG: RdgB/HAM1 family non-canonical purine NTP pyrophosphatase [Betaproteobacteria bacterium]|nr:RdgB/HAM1 family non-canonical purine NTP pyrophosphatase [Betaproteobacteria bacterium]